MPAATLTDAGKNLRRNAQRASLSDRDARILYVAIGTSSTAPTSGDTALGAEVFRKAMTSDANGAAAGEGLFTLYLSPQDAIGVNIQEVGWFAGSGASGTTGSGVLVARALFAHNPKTANEAIVLVFDEIV
jgi:hypothetical protein